MTAQRASVDTLITNATIVSMDTRRRIFQDGAIAISGDRLAAVGPTKQVLAEYECENRIDGGRFVITPGLINGHIHITGDPLTRAWLPDKLASDFIEELTHWVLPRFHAHSPDDECVSAELAAVKMLRTGTTSFIEAGTVNYLDRVVEGAQRTGIRGRVGIWVEGFSADEKSLPKHIAEAIRKLEKEAAEFPGGDSERISAWPILVGHSTNPDEVWQAAKSIADSKGLGVAAHMSPYEDDPNWFLERYGHRPIEHLAEIGVLDKNVCLTHVAHIDESELQILAASRTNAVLCPLAALRGAFGLTSVGRFPEMVAAGVNVMLGTDGFDQDLWRQAHLASGIFKDARRDAGVLPAEILLEMLTVNGAAGLGLNEQIGSLEAGKKADFVCHDTDRPEWQPQQGIVNQLAWLTDGRSVHSVWVDGNRVIDNYHSTMIDEQALYERARRSSAAVMERTGVPVQSPWPLC